MLNTWSSNYFSLDTQKKSDTEGIAATVHALKTRFERNGLVESSKEFVNYFLHLIVAKFGNLIPYHWAQKRMRRILGK